jgi:hypothetical protein
MGVWRRHRFAEYFGGGAARVDVLYIGHESEYYSTTDSSHTLPLDFLDYLCACHFFVGYYILLHIRSLVHSIGHDYAHFDRW